jgi:hypothetical protein
MQQFVGIVGGLGAAAPLSRHFDPIDLTIAAFARWSAHRRLQFWL